MPRATVRIRRKAPRRALIARRLMARRRVATAPRVHSFKRTWYSENYYSTGSVTGAQGYGINFQFNMLPGYTDFTSLFDQYKIKKVVFSLIPKISEASLALGATNNSALVNLHSAIDHDDSTAPTSINQLCQYESYKTTRGHNVHTRVLVPKIELSNGASTSTPKAYQWIDTADATVPHYGVKLWIPFITASTIVYYDLKVTMYFDCKGVL